MANREFYKVELEEPNGKKHVFKNCVMDLDNIYLRPVNYRNGSNEHSPTNDPEEDIGYEYQVINIPYGARLKASLKK